MSTTNPVAEAGLQAFELSPQQKRLWQLQENGSYCGQMVLLLRGGLVADRLRRALCRVVEQHQIFRTTYHNVAGFRLPLQRIAEGCPLQWRRVDLSPISSGEQLDAVAALLDEERQNPFDWQEGPLLRAVLVSLAAQRHQLLLSLPSLCADSWTLHNLFKALAKAYQASEPADREETLQYVQFAQWQNDLLQDEEAPQGKVLWRKRDASAHYKLELPFYHRPPHGGSSFETGSVRLPAEPDDWRRLQEAAQQRRVPPAVFLLACWQSLLWRLTGKPDVVIGAVSDGRGHEVLHDAMGLYSKWLPVRCRFRPSMRLREVLQRADSDWQEACQWQEHFVLSASRPIAGSEAAQPAYFAAGFQFGTRPGEIRCREVAFSICRQRSFADRFDILLDCSECEGSWSVEFHYRTDCCEQSDIRRLSKQWQALLGQALAEPQRPLGEFNLLGDAERYQLVYGFNDTQAPAPADRCLHTAFEEQAERSPDRISVVFEESHLSFGDLDRRAGRLASSLRGRGVRPESVVALALDRCLEMVVGMLGVLKSGGAYLPLNLLMPPSSLSFALRDSQAAAVLSRSDLLDRLPGGCPPVLCCDRGRQWASGEDGGEEAPASSGNLAYLMYTSGSTGRPKAVAVEHRHICTYLDSISRRLDLPAQPSFAMLSTFAADLGMTALYPPLLQGGQVHVISEARLSDPAALAAYFESHPVACLKIVPSHLAALTSYHNPSRILPRSLLVLGGEAVRWDWVETLQAAAPQCRIFNHYGPTESCVGVTAGRIRPGARLTSAESAPLGFPLAGSRIYLLDAWQQPVPLWSAGEILIGGRQLARGYLGRPRLTAQRFVPDPFARSQGGRLYRSGDLARRLPDGSLDFLGRCDHQVKLRGFRIELGEIESALLQHPDVRAAAVLLREDQPGDARLVAFLAEEQPEGESGQAKAGSGDIREFLRQRLPEYMVPSAIVRLQSLPLNPNGKVDRQALPEKIPQDSAAQYTAPLTPTEELLAGIWADVLSVERVGTRQRFFDLGGHSLLATQLISRICRAFSIELPLRALFEKPTVEELARRIDRLRLSGSARSMPPLVRRENREKLPLSFAQQRLWFLDQLEPGNPFYNVPAAFRLHGRLDMAALAGALDAIVRRHEILRSCFPAAEDSPVQAIQAAHKLSVPLVDLQGCAPAQREQQLRRWTAEQARRPFDLARGPLLRLLIVRLGPDDHALLGVMHHIVSDAWSRGIFLREVQTLYASFARGVPSPLPPLAVQYADFASWQREWLSGSVLEEQLQYWKERLAGAESLQLPLDHPRPSLPTFRGGRHRLSWPSRTVEPLLEISRRHDVTLHMTLLALFAILMHRLSGQSDLSAGVPIANRNQPETEPLIGFFLNTLVLRMDLSGDPSFEELLKRVREASLQAYAHQDVPFEQVVETLQPQRSLNRAPLFQVMFSLQHAGPAQQGKGQLKVTRLEAATGRSKFDLALLLLESGSELEGVMEYSAELFESTTIRRMLGHLRRLADRVAAGDVRPIGWLALLSRGEGHQLLTEWNHTPRQPLPERCLPALISRQASRTPDRIACLWKGSHLSYGDLERRSNQLAWLLRSRGARPEACVGWCVERSLEMAPAFLGILKTGAAYVPLDPAYPVERLDFMLSNSRSLLLVTQQGLLEKFSAQDAATVCLDRDWREIARHGGEGFPERHLPDNPAYVIYTSGSTGTPKGVVLSHRALLNLICWQLQESTPGGGLRTLQFSSLSFDASFQEMASAWTSGGTIVAVSESLRRDSARLLDLLGGEQIEALFLPFVALQHLALAAEAVGTAKLALRQILTAGEQLHITPQLAGWLDRLPDCRLQNYYGPSETHVVTTYTRDRPLSRWPALPPIGRPIAATEVYLLDRSFRPTPMGVPGEAYIGGTSLARGYLDRPALTAERFLPDPFSGLAGARLYRSGDQARYLGGGDIEFLGRVDHQVKVRGYRIELGEVESVLKQHKAAADAVVLAREDQPGNRRLVAYVVPDPLSAPRIRGHSRLPLPNGMAAAYLNKNELEAIYEEIFQDRVHTQHGITVRPGDCIVDVGANIGLFSLFALHHASDVKLYAFEPNPAAFEVLKINLELYGRDARAFPFGLSSQEGTALLTVYPRASVWSGLYADPAQDEGYFRTAVLNQGIAEAVERMEELMEGRFETQRAECRLVRLSDVIRRHRIERIDLLKIDVERAEADVIAGIDEQHWEKIQQITAEVHDIDGRLAKMQRLFEEKGFHVEVAGERLLEGTDMFHLYALRPQRFAQAAAESPPSDTRRYAPLLTAAELRRYLQKRLPEFMVPSSYVLMEKLPLTPSGKISRQSLPAPGREGSATLASFVPPQTETEVQLSGIWSAVLGIEKIGRKDSFFDLGGHSLLMTQVISRIRKAFLIEVPLRDFFQAPVLSALAQRIDELIRSAAGREDSIRPLDREGAVPLSFTQQRLWFYEKLQGPSAFYNIFNAVEISGKLHRGVLQSTLSRVVERQEALRTTFEEAESGPVQVIRPPLAQALPLIDLSSLPQGRRQAEGDSLALQERRRPFDLARGPLLRSLLLKMEACQNLLLLNMHHIISDAWSMEVLVREAGLLYQAQLEGKQIELAPLPIQYADYAAWQRRLLEGPVLPERLAYWRRRLEGMPTALRVPADRPRPPRQRHRGAIAELQLGEKTCTAMQDLCRQEGLTLFMLTAALFQIQLSHYSGSQDVVVGANIDGRDRLETEGLIGNFINQLVLRTDLSGNPSFRQVLLGARDTILEARQYEVPFEELVKELQPQRDPSRSLLFQCKVEFAESTSPPSLPGLLRFRSQPAREPFARYDLHLTLRRMESALFLSLLYDRDLFEAGTARRMLADFQSLAQMATEAPQSSLKELTAALQRHREEHQARQGHRYEKALQRFKKTRRRVVS